MNNPNPSKFRSPYREVDVSLLKTLCDLHPWTLRELSDHVGMGPSVLSNVFAGQRPLPSQYAKEFLKLIGMNADGTLDSDHGFVLIERVGREAQLADLLLRLFPNNDAGVVLLRSAATSTVDGGARSKVKFGRAYFNGKCALVVHSKNAPTGPLSSENDRFKLVEVDSLDVLLSTDRLPTKLDIVKAFAGSKFVFQLTWADFLIIAEKKGLTPADLVGYLNTLPDKV